MSELRKHSRLGIAVDVVIMDEQQNHLCSGKSRILSFGGVFVEITDETGFSENQVILCRLVLGFGDHNVPVEFTCRVTHIQHEGAGLQFLAVEEDGYSHFKRLVLINSEDPEKLQEELIHEPGLQPLDVN